DPSVQVDWKALRTHAERGTKRCMQALDSHDLPALRNALGDLAAAARCASSVNARIDAILRDGGRRGTVRAPLTGTGAICDRA
ncbi:hypothetical protein, partial [Streptomyces sp. NPDC005125]